MPSQQTPLQESDFSGRHDENQLDFSALYDRYAPMLLGVITQICSDKALAIELLSATFTKVRSEIKNYRPEKQPLFSWLLTIARSTASDAMSGSRQAATSGLQLTPTGSVVSSPPATTAPPADFVADSTAPQLSELLNSVLFKNCNPEEAAKSIGLPVETARQQLRLAMQQLRLSQKA